MVKTKVFCPSLDRLSDLANMASRDKSQLASASDEFSRILQNLRICGVWRWTGRHRLKCMDSLLAEYVVDRGLKQVRMLDFGASDGITSLDTVEYLERRNGVPVSVTMVERDIQLFRISKGGINLYHTSSQRYVLARYGRLALCLEPMEGIEGVLFNKLASRLAGWFARTLKRDAAGFSMSISLVNPAVSLCPSITTCERDLFQPESKWFESYDVVRASNVLNYSYYSEQQIWRAINIAYQYLKEGGALLVSRNLISPSAEKETGAIWQKEGNVFRRISCLDVLPEIDGIIDQFRLL